MISKELLSAALLTVKEVITIEQAGNNISWTGISIDGNDCGGAINKYELAFKIKDWAIVKNYQFQSTTVIKNESCFCAVYKRMDDKPTYPMCQEVGKTEPEAIIKAGEWLLKQIRDNQC